jgi:hypothetical protein
MTLAQMIARLTRGYIKETGRQPVGLDKLRIKMEAAEKLRQMNKVIQFPQQRSFKQEIESMINDGTIKMGGVTKQSDKVRTRNMFKDSNLNKPKPVKTEAELKAEMEASNKKSIQNLKDKLDNPEDFADGGVAGLLGERPGYQDGNLAQTMYPRGNFLNIRANAPTQKDYNIQATKDLVENLPGGVVRDVLAPAAAATLSVPYDAIQAYNRMEPGSGLAGFKDAFMSENPFSSLKERTIGAAGPLADRFNKEEEEDDEYDFSGIEGQTAFLPELFMLGKSVIGPAIALGKSGLSKKAIAEALVKDRLRKEAGKKFKKIITPPKYPQGSTIKTKGPTTTRPGGDRGRNIVSGRSGDRDFSPRGPDTSSNPRGRSNRASQERGYALHGADGGLANFADGGPARQNFAMGKRAFLKLMGGVGAGIAGLKSGLIGMGGKKAAVKEVVKQSVGSGTPPPYFFKLAEKIKKLGSDTTPTNDRTVAKSLKSKDGKSDYILEEDVASGDTIIKKVNKEGDEMITDVQIMELRKGEVVRGKDGKPKKTPDEYEEVTEANARIEGDVFNDPYYSDGIEIDDILREVDDIPVPKASGGIARMLGE